MDVKDSRRSKVQHVWLQKDSMSGESWVCYCLWASDGSSLNNRGKALLNFRMFFTGHFTSPAYPFPPWSKLVLWTSTSVKVVERFRQVNVVLIAWCCPRATVSVLLVRRIRMRTGWPWVFPSPDYKYTHKHQSGNRWAFSFLRLWHRLWLLFKILWLHWHLTL